MWKSVEMIKFKYKHDLQVLSGWMEGNEEVLDIFKFLPKIGYPDLSRKHENWLIFKFFFIHCETVKVSQNDHIVM